MATRKREMQERDDETARTLTASLKAVKARAIELETCKAAHAQEVEGMMQQINELKGACEEVATYSDEVAHKLDLVDQQKHLGEWLCLASALCATVGPLLVCVCLVFLSSCLLARKQACLFQCG